ncbi:hypothetical protein ACFLTU_08720 [Bacteroidota bacterium]
MKNTVLLFILTLSFISAADAQWHYRSCGVSDIYNCTPEEFECMWKKSTNTVIIGAITTTVGTSLFFTGIYIAGMNDSEDWTVQYYSSMGAGFLLVTGFIIDFVGISILVIGVERWFELRSISDPSYRNIGSLNVSPKIGINQFNYTCNFGLTLSFTF